MRIVLGDQRQLTDRFMGFNTPIMWDMPFEDPKAMPLFAGLHSGLFRFPGGLIANHWDWRSGRVSVPESYPGSFRAGSVDAVRHHPMGSSYEDFADFAEDAGAELNLVLNIETASVQNQVEWVEHLLEKGYAPSRIELGNEMYFAGFFGARDRFPNCEAYLEISKDYIDAIRPLVPNARFAVQSSASRCDTADPGDSPFEQHLAKWDEALFNADWFDATVVHVYPELIGIANPGVNMTAMMGATRRSLKGVVRSVVDIASEEHAATLMGALLARVEEGTRRQTEFLDAQTGGKEIWVTEWGVGENVAYYRGENPVVTALWVQVMARHIQSFLRSGSITQILNHSLYFDGRIWGAIRRVESEEHYRKTGAYDMFSWFGQALDVRDGKITVHNSEVEGASLVPAGTESGESYSDVTATVIDAGSAKRTAIVQNTSGRAVTIELNALHDRAPEVAEVMHTPELRQTHGYSTPEIASLATSLAVELPNNSLARFVWSP